MSDKTDEGIDTVARRAAAMKAVIERFRQIRDAEKANGERPSEPFASDRQIDFDPLRGGN